jgi:acetyl esterase
MRAMALDEATTKFLNLLVEGGGPPLHEMTPDEARALGPKLRSLCADGPEVARVADLQAPGPAGAVPIRLYAPEGLARGLVVYLHGGGWVVGALDEWDPLARELVDRSGCAVALVDYRLAPEHRYPAAVDDAWAALTWACEHVEELAGGAVPVVVAGDSAGGNLAAVLARRARDAGGPELALQVLVYPVSDCDFHTASYLDPANELFLSRDGMLWFFDHYVPDQAARMDPDVSPLRAPDLAGLPPAVVLHAEHDVLRDEGQAYAGRLRDAGVPVQERVFDGQMHAFFSLVGVLPGSYAGIDYVAEALASALPAARPENMQPPRNVPSSAR